MKGVSRISSRNDCCDHCAPTTAAVADLKVDVAEIKTDTTWQTASLKRIEGNLVSKAAFGPVQRIVYGIVGAILLGVLAWAGTALLQVKP